MPSAVENTCALDIRLSPKLGTRSLARAFFLTRARREKGPHFQGLPLADLPLSLRQRDAERESKVEALENGGRVRRDHGTRVLPRGGDRVPNLDLAYRVRRKYFDTGLALPMYILPYLGKNRVKFSITFDFFKLCPTD